MFKELLDTEQTLGIVGIISILIFFLSFLYMLFVVFRLDKKFISKMSSLPLEENKIINN